MKDAWSWYNRLSIKSILITGIVSWMALSVILLNSWFLVVYVAAHCLTTGLFFAAILRRMPRSEMKSSQSALESPAEQDADERAGTARRVSA